MNSGEPFLDESPGEPSVRGFIHRASKPFAGLVLTHGAGGNCNAPLLVALAQTFSADGITVLRCDLPFRQKRPHGPPSPASAKEDQAGLRRAVMSLQKLTGGKVGLGGQSYGGRQASMLCAAESGLVRALLLLSYPLHPPGKPQQLRTAHLPYLQTPTLFVSGTKDPFGTIAELETARKLIPASTQLISMEGAGHSLLTKKNQAELVSSVVAAFREMMAV
ncbi:MAG TPA: alpha/beta family hydrolase [Terriglobales bacterium]|nr:alpha/beta family hydrolase [Terriglobales bacterium]